MDYKRFTTLRKICGFPTSDINVIHCIGSILNFLDFHTLINNYVDHRLYLLFEHPFKKQKKTFHGKQEFNTTPQHMTKMTLEQIYNKVKYITNKL